MAIFGVSNQLLQIDTGSTRTYIFNKGQSPIQIYAGLGRSAGSQGSGTSVPSTRQRPIRSGAPESIMLVVYYQSTGNPAPQSAPAPVYWTDNTYTTVTGVESESLLGLNGIAGYLMLNTTSLPTLTATLLNGTAANPSQVIIRVGGYLVGSGLAPAATVSWRLDHWKNRQLESRPCSSRYSSWVSVVRHSSDGCLLYGLCNILLNCDII